MPLAACNSGSDHNGMGGGSGSGSGVHAAPLPAAASTYPPPHNMMQPFTPLQPDATGSPPTCTERTHRAARAGAASPRGRLPAPASMFACKRSPSLGMSTWRTEAYSPPVLPAVPEPLARVVTQSWARITDAGLSEECARRHYRSFLTRCDDTARRTFVHTDMLRHYRVFSRSLTRLLVEVTAPSQRGGGELGKLAAKHAHYGVTPQQLVFFCECLVEVVVDVLLDHSALPECDADEVRTAWEIVLCAFRVRFESTSELCRDALRLLDDARRGADPPGVAGGREATPLASDAGDARSDSPSSDPVVSEQQDGDGRTAGDNSVASAFEALRASAAGVSADSAGGSDEKRKSMPSVCPADHEGWLHFSMYMSLRPRRDPAQDGHHLDWFRPRWCQLQGQYLYYFVDLASPPAGLIDLGYCELLDTGFSGSLLPNPGPFSFALRREGTPPYYLIARGDYDKDQWFARLRQACNRFSFVRADIAQGEQLRVWLKEAGAHATGVCRWVGRRRESQQRGPIAAAILPPAPLAAEGAGDADGMWVGVELDTPISGGHGGQGYFTCPPGRGIVVPAHQVSQNNLLDIQVEGEGLVSRDSGPGDFEFLTVIGKGAYGRVCKVRERRTGDIFACKVLQKAALVKEGDRRNVRREKSLLLNISHPYIVKLHSVFQTPGRLFLLFTFLSGGELFYHLSKDVAPDEGGFPEHRARFYIAEIALAIGHLHSRQIIHRDLKAQNLVLDEDGHVVLTDFGFAKTIDAGMQNTTRCGTPPYMAPEILQQTKEGYSYEVDWWALGVLLFLMLTGRYPFWHRDAVEMCRQILHRRITAVAEDGVPTSGFPKCKSPLSRASRDICCELLQKAPARRLADLPSFAARPWFEGSNCPLEPFDWERCERRELPPPFVPERHGKNTKYFKEPMTVNGSGRDDGFWFGGVGASPKAGELLAAREAAAAKLLSASPEVPNPLCPAAGLLAGDDFVSFCDVHRDYKDYRRRVRDCGHGFTRERSHSVGGERCSITTLSPECGVQVLTGSNEWHSWASSKRSDPPHPPDSGEEDQNFLHDLNASRNGDSPPDRRGTRRSATPPPELVPALRRRGRPRRAPAALLPPTGDALQRAAQLQTPCARPSSPAHGAGARSPLASPSLSPRRLGAPRAAARSLAGFRLWPSDALPCPA